MFGSVPHIQRNAAFRIHFASRQRAPSTLATTLRIVHLLAFGRGQHGLQLLHREGDAWHRRGGRRSRRGYLHVASHLSPRRLRPRLVYLNGYIGPSPFLLGFSRCGKSPCRYFCRQRQVGEADRQRRSRAP